MIKKDNFNYGCALLRTLMCFEVVCCHFWEMNSAAFLQPFWMLRNYAVPVFMFMSFYFSGSLYQDNAGRSITRRIWRLTLPLLGWGAIYFVVYYALGINNINSISALLWQIVTGHSAKLNPAMWYQCVLIWLNTAVFLIIFIVGDVTKSRDMPCFFLLHNFYLDIKDDFLLCCTKKGNL